MPDEKDKPATRDTRWWMKSEVVRLAFGQETLAAPPGEGAAVGAASRSELDPNDPAQREFGDYELREIIGRGGMGLVYRAFQKSLDREVAIKLLSAGMWASPEFVSTMQSEARYAALLQHPNIVTIYEIGECNGLVYYAMQLAVGHSLADRIQNDGPLPPHEAAQLIRTVAEAVDYAHRQGMLHLDLKPGNLIIDADHNPKITDFGLARRLGVDGRVDNERVSGTPGYMAPEQVQVHGEKLSPATDVWGLGAILYEALTGHQPFEGTSPQDVIGHVLHGQVRNPRRYNEDIPHDLEAICLRCLHKDPAQRYRTARALADDLGHFIEGREVRARPLNRLQRGWHWARREPRLAVVSVLAVLALVVGALAAAREWRRAEAHSLEASGHLWAQRHETAWRLFEESRGYAALAPLAANLREQEAAGATDAALRERLRLGIAEARMPALLTMLDLGTPIHVLAFNHDASLLAVGIEPSTVALYERASGRQRWRVRLQQHQKGWDGQLRRLVFTPDRRHLIVSEHWTMNQIRPSGDRTYRLALADGRQTVPPGADGLLGESWSDDGQHVLLHDRHGQAALYRATDWTRLAQAPTSGAWAQFRPGWLLPPGLGFVAARPQPDRIELLDPRDLRPRHRIPVGRAGDAFTAWSSTPDGRWLLLGTRQGRVIRVDPRDGSTLTLMADADGEINWLSTSAAGRRLAASARGGGLSLWSMPDGRPVHKLVHRRELWGHQLECTASGDRCIVLAMHWDRVAMWSLASVDGHAARAVQLAPEITHHSFVPRFASAFDRERGILATGSQDGILRLWRLPMAPELPLLAAPQRESPLRFDGVRLVQVDGLRVRIVDAATGKALSGWATLPQPVGFAALSPDGRSLVATAGAAVHVFATDDLRARYAPIALPGAPLDLLISADGRTLVTRWLPPRPAPARDSRIQAFDLTLGHPLGPSGDTPFVQARLSANGQSLLVVEDRGSRIYDIRNLRRPRLHLRSADADSVVVAAEFDEARREVVQSVESTQANLKGQLQRWSLLDGRLLDAVPLRASVDSLLVEPGNGRVSISGRPGGTASTDVAVRIARDGVRSPITLAGEGGLARAQALSADGTILAQALYSGVMLIDAGSGVALGPPLQAALPASDAVAQVALGADGRSVLARTALGRWLLWRLTPDRRPARLIAEEAALLSPPPSAPFVPPTPALRASWQARRDQVAPQSPALPSPWSCLARAQAPPRLRGTPERLVNLDVYYNAPLHDVLDSTLAYITPGKALGNLCGLPMGMQRLRGVDYDIRGLVRLPTGAAAPLTIALPPGRYPALRILAVVNALPPELMLTRPVARIVFHYADGSRAEQPWRTTISSTEMNGWEQWPEVALAWEGSTPRSEVMSDDRAMLFSTRVDNPHPERALNAIGLQSIEPLMHDGAVFVAAVTLEE